MQNAGLPAEESEQAGLDCSARPTPPDCPVPFRREMTSVADPSAVARNGYVVPVLPLALLEAVRSHDHPQEVLEDENLAHSLPRRLGLSDVVLTQIRRYEGEVQAGRRVPLSELMDLLRLVLRRPDAAEVLMDAGRDVARRRFEKVSKTSIRLHRVLPLALALPGVRRAVRKLLRSMAGNARITARNPLVISMGNSPTGRLDGTACVLYTGAIEELARLYVGKERRVVHSRCSARGDALCEWSMEL
jgi:predicted hydrocarbon binding protein